MGEMALKTRTWGNEDQRWIGNGGRPGLHPISIVLDRSGFDLVTAFPNGSIPSGVCLGRISATGLYVPFVGGTTEVQTVTEGGSGLTSFTLTYAGQTTASIAAAATAATVKAELAALSNLDGDDFDVTGSASGPYTVTFKNVQAGENVPALTATPTGGSGTVTIATTTAGGASGATDGSEVMAGHLFTTVEYDRNAASTADLHATLFIDGTVIETFLPTGHGLTPKGKADVKGHIRYETRV